MMESHTTHPKLCDPLPDNRIRCRVCEVRCVVKPGQLGFCGTRYNTGSELVALNYARISGACADPVEKKPLYHFHPGSRVFSVGSVGCNFRCPGCQNWSLSRGQAALSECTLLKPEELVRQALGTGCQGIAWTYNEPSIWIEYCIDAARLAQSQGLYTVWVTNGYCTPEALELIAPYLDAYRVDLKGFSRRTYRRISGLGKWEVVLDQAKAAKQRYGLHVECVTNITPTINNDPQEIRGLAEWIRNELGPETPWHISRFQPHQELSHLPPTSIETLEGIWDIARAAGMLYVYVGNVPGHWSENTTCQDCQEVLIRRQGYRTVVCGLRDGECQNCGSQLEGVWD